MPIKVIVKEFSIFVILVVTSRTKRPTCCNQQVQSITNFENKYARSFLTGIFRIGVEFALVVQLPF